MIQQDKEFTIKVTSINALASSAVKNSSHSYCRKNISFKRLKILKDFILPFWLFRIRSGNTTVMFLNSFACGKPRLYLVQIVQISNLSDVWRLFSQPLMTDLHSVKNLDDLGSIVI